MTVKRLYELCKEEIKNGNGDREIILCTNDNDFNMLEGGFSSAIYNNNYIYEFLDVEMGGINDDEIIVLN